MTLDASTGGALPAPYSALVITASNRAAAGVYEDKGGPLVADGLGASASPSTDRGSCPTATP